MKKVLVLCLALFGFVLACESAASTAKPATSSPTASPLQTSAARPTLRPTLSAPTDTPTATATVKPSATAKPPTAEPTIANGGAGCPQGCTEHPPGCDIKGNVNSSNEKIYHLPGSPGYSNTLVRPAEGDRWFCTAEEAIANGFRGSQQ